MAYKLRFAVTTLGLMLTLINCSGAERTTQFVDPDGLPDVD